MKIELTEFAKRHFEKDFNGTKLLDVTPNEFLKYINDEYLNFTLGPFNNAFREDGDYSNSIIRKGYAGFCIQLFIRNTFSESRTGTMKLGLDNFQYLKSEYSTRREGELPVMSRWLEIPKQFVPRAEWFNVILYDRSHLLKENSSGPADSEFELSDNCEWGIVAILGQQGNDEEPMKPETMLRNYMPLEYGGSGMKFPTLKKDQHEFNSTYMKSVSFWQHHATVK